MDRLFVGNIPWSTTEADLRGFFAEFDVEKIHLIANRATGRSRGCAFVTMVNASDVEIAIVALDGGDLGGRSVRVRRAGEPDVAPRVDTKRSGWKNNDLLWK
jgi:RNA recognition motif-containing protein